MIQAQERIVAVGTPPEVLDLVSSSIRNAAGASLPEKLATCRKSVNKSLSSSKSVTTIGPSGDGSSLTVEMADGTAAFHVAMQIRCMFGCVMTAGHADYLSTDLDVTKKVYRAISARAFSSSEFSFVALIPDIINRPSLVAMKISMKELEDGRMIGSSTYYQSAADDALHYPWLRWGLLTFVAVEGPNFELRRAVPDQNGDVRGRHFAMGSGRSADGAGGASNCKVLDSRRAERHAGSCEHRVRRRARACAASRPPPKR